MYVLGEEAAGKERGREGRGWGKGRTKEMR